MSVFVWTCTLSLWTVNCSYYFYSCVILPFLLPLFPAAMRAFVAAMIFGVPLLRVEFIECGIAHLSGLTLTVHFHSVVAERMQHWLLWLPILMVGPVAESLVNWQLIVSCPECFSIYLVMRAIAVAWQEQVLLFFYTFLQLNLKTIQSSAWCSSSALAD